MYADPFETPERGTLREAMATFVRREVVPFLDAWERAGEIPRELHAGAAKAGLYGVGFPEEAGGDGGDTVDMVVATEAFLEAGGSSGAHAALFTHGIALPHMIAAGDPSLIDRFVRPALAGQKIGSLGVTEPDAGSDVGALRTTAVRDGDDYVVNGAKMFITSGTRADFVTTAVRTGGPGAAGISLLVVERGTPGFTVSRKLDKMGWHCSDTAELSFADCRVPAANLIGAEHGGFPLIAQVFVPERIITAVHAYSVAQRCLDLTLVQVRARETFGRPLISRQVVRHKLVEMRQRIELARTFTRRVAARHAAGDWVPGEACLAKNAAVDAGKYVVDEAVQLHGGMGYLRESEVERHYRDIRILGIGAGATEVMADLAAKIFEYDR
ncbi:acyl-CoA dehydrogenase [Actinoplanes sp. SE50]|uniref:acyl-CoA dehydrogenase family protein n=1 Tax=unclassified Actinoplanes TaxID=2626549 RepID=UPI00023ECF29|nr:MULTISPECIES: acyl-CoA dehydrogenase family protein [unclassified Actinoplanes]AEV86627.1 acyl-CoA dehydrogenase [Actinoplanes sp. SE50/110]ATO85025.1 acyl-CoA dehydrogenase [Actinoplanes sp. SE50]SLM02435.1 acyl-CoA dehydrogenase [Actinoplanes sp. SE50/110]